MKNTIFDVGRKMYHIEKNGKKKFNLWGNI